MKRRFSFKCGQFLCNPIFGVVPYVTELSGQKASRSERVAVAISDWPPRSPALIHDLNIAARYTWCGAVHDSLRHGILIFASDTPTSDPWLSYPQACRHLARSVASAAPQLHNSPNSSRQPACLAGARLGRTQQARRIPRKTRRTRTRCSVAPLRRKTRARQGLDCLELLRQERIR